MVMLGYPLLFEKEDLSFASERIMYSQTANERFYGTKSPVEIEMNNFNVLNFIDKERPPMFFGLLLKMRW
ncbi:hypothetical protein ACE38V_19895 [Cytobacillus sp. Hz8]